MKSTRKIIKVFIGSPGDLTDERTLARDVASEYNLNNSNLTGYQIEMVGWEETIGGIGRPQELINKDLAGCELFVGMLWKRWGTPPDKTGRYTSGFEEEFSLSFQKYKSEKVPQMLMLFKDVDKALLQDPGSELKKVIDFKERLISEKEVLYETFDNARSFEIKLRRFLTNYVNELFESEISGSVSEGTDDKEASSTHENPFKENNSFSNYSNQSANFINKLVAEVKGNTTESLTSADIAFFRLLANSLSKPGNDDVYLGAHDANLIFLHQEKFDIGESERTSLASAGLDSFDNHNTPLWQWLDLDEDSIRFYLIFFRGKLKAKLIDALTLVGEELGDYRNDEIAGWFAQSQSDDLKIAAAKYLARLGRATDIPILSAEYERKDFRTDFLVGEALILIEMRESVERGFDKYIELQPTSLSFKSLSLLREGQDSLDNNRLYVGLNSKNTDVKLLCIDKLNSRGCLTSEILEKIIEGDDYKLRARALQYLSDMNGIFYKDRAKAVLVISNGGNNNDEHYKNYVLNCQIYDTKENLEKENNEFSLTAIPLISLARINKKKYLPIVRGIIEDGCNQYYDKKLLSILPAGKVHDEFFSGSAKDFVTNRMTSELLTWLSSCMLKEDLVLIRKVVSKNIYASVEVLNYFYKHGEWADITLLSSAKLSSSQTLLGLYSDNSLHSQIADIALKVGRGREIELLDLDINKAILAIIISRLPSRAFSEFSDDRIAGLLNDSSHKIRENAAVKAIDCLSKFRVKGLLRKVMSGQSYYYNSVHWLDMGASVKRNFITAAVKHVLAE